MLEKREQIIHLLNNNNNKKKKETQSYSGCAAAIRGTRRVEPAGQQSSAAVTNCFYLDRLGRLCVYEHIQGDIVVLHNTRQDFFSF